MSRISKKLQDKVRRDAKNLCGYCRSPQMLIPIPFEMEHILPISMGGTSEEENLWLACQFCNSFNMPEPTHSIRIQMKKQNFSIRESKFGISILGLVRIKLKLLEKRLAAEQP